MVPSDFCPISNCRPSCNNVFWMVPLHRAKLLHIWNRDAFLLLLAIFQEDPTHKCFNQCRWKSMNIRERWTTCSQLQPYDCESTIVRLHWLRRVWQQARTRAAFADNRHLSSRNDLRVVFCGECGRPPRVGLFVEHLDQDPVVFRLVGGLGFCGAPNLNGFGKLGSLVWRPGYFWVPWQKWTMTLSVAESRNVSGWFLEMGLYSTPSDNPIDWIDGWWLFMTLVADFILVSQVYKDETSYKFPAKLYRTCKKFQTPLDYRRYVQGQTWKRTSWTQIRCVHGQGTSDWNHGKSCEHIQTLYSEPTCKSHVFRRAKALHFSRHLHIVVFDFLCRPMESTLVDLPSTKSNDFRVTAKWMTRDRTHTHAQRHKGTTDHCAMAHGSKSNHGHSYAFLQWNDLCKPSPKHLPLFSGSTDLKRPW